MNAKIEINMDNAAFLDCPNSELARILRELANRLENSVETDFVNLRDINGNRVGTFVRE